MTIKTPDGKAYDWSPPPSTALSGHDVILAPTRDAMSRALLDRIPPQESPSRMIVAGPFAGTPRTIIAGKCGNTARFEPDGLPSYRCETCNAVVGSVAMPAECRPVDDPE